MIYFKSKNGEVYAYNNQAEREQYGSTDLVAMTQEEVDVHLNPPTPPPQTPQSVTMRQARLALHAAGLLDQVDAAIDGLTEPLRAAARIEWDYSSEVYRDKDFVQMLGASLGLDSDTIDQLFVSAATL